MRRPRLLLVTWRALGSLLLLGAAACGAADEPTAPTPQRFETVTTVLESPEHGPELCLGGIQQSCPPQCGGVPVANWDWAAAGGVESANGTTWGGDYRLVGTYDGTTFTLTEPPAAPQRPAQEPLESACADPATEGASAPVDRVDKAALGAAMSAASAAPDFAGLWVADMGSYVEGVRFDDAVLNVAFTGDLARHEREIRMHWGGQLCLVEQERTEAELRATQDALFPDGARELGLEPTFASVDVVGNVVELGVVAVTPEQQAALDERYGPGAVEVRPGLEPLD